MDARRIMPTDGKQGVLIIGINMIKIGYMCKTDYEHELGSAVGGVIVYSSIEDLKEHKKCWQDCGIVEVLVELNLQVTKEKEDE